MATDRDWCRIGMLYHELRAASGRHNKALRENDGPTRMLEAGTYFPSLNAIEDAEKNLDTEYRRRILKEDT